MSMKICNNTIGNRTRDLSPGSTVPQPTAPCMPAIILLDVALRYSLTMQSNKPQKLIAFESTNFHHI